MFRITCIISARSLLYRRPVNTQLANISYSCPNFKYKDPTERDTCKIPPPPPPPPRKEDRVFWGTMAVLFVAGGFAVFAKNQPEVRDWLSLNAPWFDDFIAVAYQENMTYGEFALQCLGDLKQKMVDYFDDGKSKICSDDEPVWIVPKEKPKEPICEEEKPCDKLLPPLITKDLCEIEKCLRDLGETSVNNYLTAKDACAYYNKLVEEKMLNFSLRDMKELRDAMDERIELVKESVENATKASAELDDIVRYFDCGLKASKEAIDNARALLKEYQTKIKTNFILYAWENDRALVMDAQWQKVEELMGKYIDENQTMFPGLKYTNEKPHIAGDADLHLHHSLRYVEKLRADLSEASAGMTERVNRGLETLPQSEKDKKARDAEIQAGYRKRKAEMDKEYKKRSDDQKAANDKLLKESLKKQLEKSQETLAIRVQQKEIEATERLNKMVAEKVASEKAIMKKQLTEMAMKLKMVEDKLNARLKAERETRRSQELWSAGASLLAATKKGDPYVNVDRELRAIEKASGDSDKLVVTVLHAIPASVRNLGLVPESVLREKYHSMEQTALKVALVEHDGAPLPVYFLSWLQSIMLFMKISGIPQEEIDKPPQEPSKDLDTFDLLQRARFWIERGNIANALRYVSSLEGASRGAAGVWAEAARSHLETRQAAEAVLAHAAAMGLQYI